MLGFLYPVYKSMKALGTSSKDDDSRWLVYWMVFSVLSILDILQLSVKSVTDYLPLIGGILYGIPFYYEVKLAVIILLLAGGDAIIAERVMPLFTGIISNLDQFDRVFLSVITNPAFDKIDEGVTAVKPEDVHRHLDSFASYLTKSIETVQDPEQRKAMVAAIQKGDLEEFARIATKKEEKKEEGCCCTIM